MRRRKAPPVIPAALLALAAGLAGCQRVRPPEQADVCFQASFHKDGKVDFNTLSAHEANMEGCAAALEGMRERFLSLGGGNHAIVGAYNGKFLFLDAGGVQMSDSLDGMRFPFLAHTEDGRLVAPGAAQDQ
jgi:hypothetical protein